MTEITVSVDTHVVDKAHRVASDRRTTLDALVRDFVEQLAVQAHPSRSSAVAELERSFRELARPMGGTDWTSREELHER